MKLFLRQVGRSELFVGVALFGAGFTLLGALVAQGYEDRRVLMDEDVDAAARLSGKKKQFSVPFFVGLVEAMSIKLTSSIDDVVWLTPFVIMPDKKMVATNTAIYLWVCAVQAVLAIVISQGGIAAIEAIKGSEKGWSPEKILTCFAGVSLVGYGAFIAKEYYDETWGPDAEEAEYSEESSSTLITSAEEGSSTVIAFETNSTEPECELTKRTALQIEAGSGEGGYEKAGPEDGEPSDEEEEEAGAVNEGDGEGQKKGRTSSSLFIVAFLGSLDDLTLFVPMLAGQALHWTELCESG